MRQVRNFAILAAAAALVACATEAPSTPAPAPQVVAAHVVPANPAATAAAAPASKTVIPRGYTRVMMEDGVERFCRDEPVKGTRTQHETVCFTAEQLKENEDGTQRMMEEMNRHNASTFNGGRTN
jgi:putative hemolysin